MRTGLAALALMAALVVVAPAAADSIVYMGSDGNVWLVRPDGSGNTRLAARSDPNTSWQSPTQADDGTVVVADTSDKDLLVFNRDGSPRGVWSVKFGAFSSGPYDAAVIPTNGASGLIAYAFSRSDALLDPPFAETAFQATNISTPENQYPRYGDFDSPRWITGTLGIGMIDSGGDNVVVQANNSNGYANWLAADPGETVNSFDVSRTGNHVLLESTIDPGAVPRLQLWDNQVTPPGLPSAPQTCFLSPFGNADSEPHWSPDGTRFTWSDSQGVWVSPAPVNNGGTCVVSPKLIVPGGKEPDWGPADVPTPPKPPPPPCCSPPARDTVAPTMRGASFSSSAVLAAKGLVLNVTLSEDATVTVQITQRVRGRRKRGRCNPRARSGPRCTLTVVRRRFTLHAKAGANRFTLRLRGLKPGAYAASLLATDAAANKSAPTTLRFRIKSPPRRRHR